jgi:sulfur-oxidizing protein SoxA
MRWLARLVGAATALVPGIALPQQVSGLELFVQADKGNCAVCHQVPASVLRSPRADVGPGLDANRMKGWDKERLRVLLEDPLPGNPETVMPPYGRHLILEPSEIDRVADFLLSLPPFAEDESASESHGLPRQTVTEGISPASRAAEAIEEGRRLWLRKFGKNRSLAGCFPNGGRRIAAAYPQYDPRLKRVVTLETAINQCLKSHGQPMLDAGDPDTMGAVLAYLRSLSEGQTIAIRVQGAEAKARLDEGRRLYFTRMGQQSFACATCHVRSAGRHFGGSVLPASAGSAVYWPYFRGGKAETLQVRVRTCLDRMGAAAYPAGSDELASIEYYLASLANGVRLRPNSPR